MDPSRDHPFARFAAFWWGLGVILLFFVVLLATRAIVGGDEVANPLEETARKQRLKTLAQVEAAQAENFKPTKVADGRARVHPHAVFQLLGQQLVESRPTKVDDPAQVIPGSAAAMMLAEQTGDLDLEAVDTLTPPAGTAPDPAVMERGEQLYMVCMGCHGMNGEGMPNVGPPLAGSEWVKGPVSNLIRIQYRGLQGPITVAGEEYNLIMAAVGAANTNEDTAAVLTYIRNSFGNSAPPVLPEQAEMLRSEIGKPMLTVEELIDPTSGS